MKGSCQPGWAQARVKMITESQYPYPKRAELRKKKSLLPSLTSKGLKSLFLLVPLFGFTATAVAAPIIAYKQDAVEVKTVRRALDLPVPGEPATVDVKISTDIPQDVTKVASELLDEYESTEKVESLSPALSTLHESTEAAGEALDGLSEVSSTVILKDVPIKQAKSLQKGTLSEEGLLLMNPDLEIEVVPLSETIKEEASKIKEQEEEQQAQLSQASLDEGIAPPIVTPPADAKAEEPAAEEEVEEEEPKKEDSESKEEKPKTRKQIVIREEPKIDDEDKDEVVEQLSSASLSLKEAKTNLSPLDRVLIGYDGNLESLSDEDFEILSDSRASDEITAEHLRRISLKNSGLSQYSNGEVDESALVPLSWNPKFLMQKDAAKMFELLNRDFKTESGYDLRITSTYRPLAVQYQVKRESPSMTATPGTSNHGYGLAVDIAAAASPFITFDSYEHQWMMENGHKYGWLHPWWAGPGGTMLEPWHFEFGTFYEDNEKEFNNEQMPEHRAKWLSFSTSIVDDYDG